MKKLNINLLIFLLSLFIVATLFSCPAKTYYLRSEDNGFSETKISDTVYVITVKTRNVKEAKRMQDIFYLRAAEIAKENGYPFFYTVDKVENIAEMNAKAKPYKQRILTAIVYENIKISGAVKLLKKKSKDIIYPILSTKVVYEQKEYLIAEKERVFGKTEATNTIVTNIDNPENNTNYN